MQSKIRYHVKSFKLTQVLQSRVSNIGKGWTYTADSGENWHTFSRKQDVFRILKIF